MTQENQLITDEDLARRAQSGCSFSFEELVHRYEARVFRFVANNARNASDAQEVTQDAFVTAFHNLEKFDANRSFATWLFTIARRKCIDHHRSARPAVGDALPEEADGNDPSELLAQREAEQDIWGLAKRVLPPLQFEALWLRCAEDMDVAEVARVLGRTKTHVKVLLFRARIRLESELDKQRDGGQVVDATERESRSAPKRDVAIPISRGIINAHGGVQR